MTTPRHTSSPVAPELRLQALIGLVELLREAGCEMPTAEVIRADVKEAAAAVAGEQLVWLTAKEAAAHLKTSPRTFERKKKALGLPRSKVFGVEVFARQDLDALVSAHATKPAVRVIDFPSLRTAPAASPSASSTPAALRVASC